MLTAEQIAQLRDQIAGSWGEGIGEEIASKLLDRVVEDSPSVFELAHSALQSWGQAFFLKHYNRFGVPTSLELLPTQDVQVVYDKNDAIRLYVIHSDAGAYSVLPTGIIAIGSDDFVP